MKHESQLKSPTTPQTANSESGRIAWLPLGMAFGLMLGLIGCSSSEGGGGAAPMSDGYGNQIGSPASKRLQMERQIEDVANGLSPTY